MELSPVAARVFSDILESRTGQELADNRLWRVETALQPLLREQGIESIERLAAMVSGGRNAPLGEAVAEALLNHESFFFRDPQAFQQLGEIVAGRLRDARSRERRLRIWSAGCSTGQEAYSLAIMFAEKAQLWTDWIVEIVGTDVSAAAVERAKAGVYSQFEIQRGLPVRQMLRWFEPQNEDWHAVPELRSKVKFHVHSLLAPAPRPAIFDVILCRNVLLYFSQAARTNVFDRLRRAIAADGILMLGAGETVLGQTPLFQADATARGLYLPTAG